MPEGLDEERELEAELEDLDDDGPPAPGSVSVQDDGAADDGPDG